MYIVKRTYTNNKGQTTVTYFKEFITIPIFGSSRCQTLKIEEAARFKYEREAARVVEQFDEIIKLKK